MSKIISRSNHVSNKSEKIFSSSDLKLRTESSNSFLRESHSRRSFIPRSNSSSYQTAFKVFFNFTQRYAFINSFAMRTCLLS